VNQDKLRLPKLVESSPTGNEILEKLKKTAKKMWENGILEVPVCPFSDAIKAVLVEAHQNNRIGRGFETADRNLSKEAKGLKLADSKSETKRGERVSRLIILSNDGAERFYRKIESLLIKHSPRVLAIIVDADSSQLGGAIYGPEKLTKLILVEHKEVVAQVLLAI
jgi:hypothetical protein